MFDKKFSISATGGWDFRLGSLALHAQNLHVLAAVVADHVAAAYPEGYHCQRQAPQYCYWSQGLFRNVACIDSAGRTG